MFQLHYHTTRPLTTAHLAQTMTMLSLTADELRQQIDAELASNPALEMIDERRCPHCHRLLADHAVCPVCSSPQANNLSDPVVFVSPRDDFYPSAGSSGHLEATEDNYTASEQDLPTYVMRQIGPELEGIERKIAAYLLTHLDEDGFLTIPVVEVARYYHVTISQVTKVLKSIQRADPIGVGASSPQEALLIQVEVLSETRVIPPLTRRIIEETMDLLSRRQYGEIARKLKTTTRQISIAEKFISENLNPFPGRSHWGDVRQPNNANIAAYHRPDILIYHQNDDPKNPLVVEIILPIQGTLRINPLFRQAIQQASEDKKSDWRNDIERASLFVKCLQQRNHTIQRMMQKLVVFQKGFILKGEKHLKPITRVQLSRELEVHESTISRAVANKTIMLPNRRIVPLSSFFDRSLNVRTILRDIIDNEPRPLSDSELVGLLSEQGYDIARRTVAKYRSMEGILPAHLRQAVNNS